MVYTQTAGTWKVMSLSTTCKVMSAWPSTSFAVDTLKMVVGAGWRWPSRSSNRCERMHIKQNWCLQSTIWCSGYIKHAPEVKPYTETLTSHLDLHWVHPQQQCDRPCPTYCYMDKAYGAVAGRIALGKSSGKGQKSHTGTSNFKKNFSFKFLAFIFLSRSCLTRTWRTGSRLSTGKSGRPRLDDSWEHSVVASERSWETLTHRKQHNTAWRHRPSKNTRTSVCIYLNVPFCSDIWSCCVQQLQLVLKIYRRKQDLNILKVSQIYRRTLLAERPERKKTKAQYLNSRTNPKLIYPSSIIANFLQYINISVCCTKCVMFIIRVHKRKICIGASLSPPQPHLSYLIETFRSYWSFQLADYFLLSNP